VNNKYDSGDMFGLFDLLAVKRGRKPVFIQVKTNGTEGSLGETLHRAKELMDLSHVDLEFWIKYDYEGWRVMRSLNGGEWSQVFDGRKTSLNIGGTFQQKYDL